MIELEETVDVEIEPLETFQREQSTWQHVLLIGDCGGAVVSESEDA